MHLGFIRNGRRAENFMLHGRFDSSKRKQKGKQSSQPPNILPEKRALDKRFGFLSKRIKLFSSACEDFKGKHIKFDSSGDDDSGSDSKSHYQGSPQSNSDVQHCVSSCPYPSTTEEIKRLGLQREADVTPPSFRKRKKGKLLTEQKKPIVLNKSMIQNFVAMWKEDCKKRPIFEVCCLVQESFLSGVSAVAF